MLAITMSSIAQASPESAPMIVAFVGAAIVLVTFGFVANRREIERRRRTEAAAASRRRTEQAVRGALQDAGFNADEFYMGRWEPMAMALEVPRRRLALGRWDTRTKQIFWDIFTDAQVVSAELVIDGVSGTRRSNRSVAGRAIVGDILAGGAGAVVAGLSGATTNYQKVRSVGLKVVVSDLRFPERRITLVRFAEPVEWEMVNAQLAAEGNPQQWLSRVQVLIHGARAQTPRT